MFSFYQCYWLGLIFALWHLSVRSYMVHILCINSMKTGPGSCSSVSFLISKVVTNLQNVDCGLADNRAPTGFLTVPLLLYFRDFSLTRDFWCVISTHFRTRRGSGGLRPWKKIWFLFWIPQLVFSFRLIFELYTLHNLWLVTTPIQCIRMTSEHHNYVGKHDSCLENHKFSE